MLPLAAPGASLESRHQDADQQVFQNAEVTLGKLPVNLALPRHFSHVQWLALREAGRLPETREGAEIPRQSLLCDFLLEIGQEIPLKVIVRPNPLFRVVQRGEQSISQSLRQVKGAPQFGRGQRVEVFYYGTSAKEIDAGATHLPCA